MLHTPEPYRVRAKAGQPVNGRAGTTRASHRLSGSPLERRSKHGAAPLLQGRGPISQRQHVSTSASLRRSPPPLPSGWYASTDRAQ
mmetsp:Transcript_5923/g.15616  ORF Transcript_5923/g.15616 Transcript_5923/m.15616 type:complete len:86 (+) Transcript_5923:209-466(+)